MLRLLFSTLPRQTGHVGVFSLLTHAPQKLCWHGTKVVGSCMISWQRTHSMRSDIFASAFSRTVSFCSGDGRTTTSDVSSRRGRFFAAACSGSGDDALLPSGRSSSETSIRVLVCEDTAQLRLHDRRQSQRGSCSRKMQPSNQWHWRQTRSNARQHACIPPSAHLL